MASPKLLLLSLFAPLFVSLCTSTDTFTTNQSIKDGDVLISSRDIFAFGFFSPVGSTRRYVGIWYRKITNQTVVWVANRDQPINDTSGIVSINRDGNIVLRTPNQKLPHWSTNTSTSQESNNQVEVQLLDTGNLVLIKLDCKRVVWQSFDHPTDTMLPGMKLGLDRKTGTNRFITSWDSPDDPKTGPYSFKTDPRGYPQFFLYSGSTRYWRAGPWPSAARQKPVHPRNFSFIDSENEFSIMYMVDDPSMLARTVVEHSGLLRFLTWVDAELRWAGYSTGAKYRCDAYGHCGAYSKCNPNKLEFECECLPGFEPKSLNNWLLRDGSDGCVRKHPNHTCLNDDGFLKVPTVRLPDTTFASVNRNMSRMECEKECLRNCSCTAYASIDFDQGENRCLRWHGELVHTQKLDDGFDLFVRVDSTELGKYTTS